MTCKKYNTCNCLSCENLRQELLESCTSFISVGYCCCGYPMDITGRLAVVGSDFIILEGPTPSQACFCSLVFNANNIKAVIIPIERITHFAEWIPPMVETSCACLCETNQNLIEYLSTHHCGDPIDVEFCGCDKDVPHCIIGTLAEIGTEFIEVRAPIELLYYTDSSKTTNSTKESAPVIKNIPLPPIPVPITSGTVDIVMNTENACAIALLYVIPTIPPTPAP